MLLLGWFGFCTSIKEQESHVELKKVRFKNAVGPKHLPTSNFSGTRVYQVNPALILRWSVPYILPVVNNALLKRTLSQLSQNVVESTLRDQRISCRIGRNLCNNKSVVRRWSFVWFVALSCWNHLWSMPTLSNLSQRTLVIIVLRRSSLAVMPSSTSFSKKYGSKTLPAQNICPPVSFFECI